MATVNIFEESPAESAALERRLSNVPRQDAWDRSISLNTLLPCLAQRAKQWKCQIEWLEYPRRLKERLALTMRPPLQAPFWMRPQLPEHLRSRILWSPRTQAGVSSSQRSNVLQRRTRRISTTSQNRCGDKSAVP